MQQKSNGNMAGYKRMKKQIMMLILVLILIQTMTAIEGDISLLTVSETGNETMGGVALLHLEIKPGTGRVFIDTFPITKTDTQISTRYAKKVACDFVDQDCSDKDFFYTIKASSNIVGGPSASGAMTVLTIALLEGTQPDPNIIMTGTINSGGIIGPVAGIEKKVIAARDKGFRTVLIPKRAILNTNITNNTKNNSTEPNITIDITYTDELDINGIEIVRINTLPEALRYFLHKDYPQNDTEVKIPDNYQKIMKSIAEKLCSRYEDIKREIPFEIIKNNEDIITQTDATQEKGINATNENDFYSAASYCFTADRDLREIQMQNLTDDEKRLIVEDLKDKVHSLELQTKQKRLSTISELETQMIVKDRLEEVRKILEENETEIFGQLGYAAERFYSAIAWSAFYQYESEKANLNKEYLEEACLTKIAEVEERKSYLEVIYPVAPEQQDEIRELNEVYQNQDYAFCLYKASKLKADINAVISTFSITEEKLTELIDDKQSVARQQMNRQDTFPILGYSYYNYAESLEEDNPTLSLIFSEYALELGNLKMYFPRQKDKTISLPELTSWQYLLLGAIIGMIIGTLLKDTKKK